MASRKLEWVNTPVLMEAILRYQQGRLPRSMCLWVEQLLEFNPKEDPQLLPNGPHI